MLHNLKTFNSDSITFRIQQKVDKKWLTVGINVSI